MESPHADLAALCAQPGPVATVYLTTEAEVENAGHWSEVRWKSLRDELVGAGAAETVVEAIDPLVPDAHREGQTLAVIAGSEGVRHHESHPEPPRRDLALWAALPAAVPLLEWRQAELPHLVVQADRLGADILAVGASGLLAEVEVEGKDFPIRKVKAGGWSQRRYQQRAENTWEHNADDVAAAAARLAHAVGARVIVASGDERALGLIRDSLPKDLTELFTIVPGGDVADAVVRVLADLVARDTVAVLEKFREEAGQQDRAAVGPEATLRALAMAQVEVLLVHHDMDDDRTAWLGPEPLHLGVTRDEVAAMGVKDPEEGRLVDVAVRAALNSGADVQAVPSIKLIKGRIGALLRW